MAHDVNYGDVSTFDSFSSTVRFTKDSHFKEQEIFCEIVNNRHARKENVQLDPFNHFHRTKHKKIFQF